MDKLKNWLLEKNPWQLAFVFLCGVIIVGLSTLFALDYLKQANELTIYADDDQSKTQAKDGRVLIIDGKKRIHQDKGIEPGSDNKQVEANGDEQWVVHVTGAVQKPGVYYLQAGSRYHQALDMAVCEKDADVQALNLAAKISDGERIVVPRKGEVPPVPTATASTQSSNVASGQKNKININTASESELMQLPGIGPAKAQAIIAYRTEQGGFKAVADIKNVTGIGDKTFDQLKDQLTV